MYSCSKGNLHELKVLRVGEYSGGAGEKRNMACGATDQNVCSKAQIELSGARRKRRKESLRDCVGHESSISLSGGWDRRNFVANVAGMAFVRQHGGSDRFKMLKQLKNCRNVTYGL